MIEYNNVFGNAETDTVIITPSVGKSIQVYLVTFEKKLSGNCIIKINGVEICNYNNGLGKHINAPGFVGNVDETLTITCPPNTTVTINYDEV